MLCQTWQPLDMKLNVSLTDELTQFIKAKVSRGRYTCLLYTSDAADE